eukprot:12138637-Karenia_brevis.AAC.1
MQTYAVNPRILADDILLTATGHSALDTFVRAFTATILHLHHIGGRVAPQKSKLFATISAHRSWLRQKVWPSIKGASDAKC